MNVYSIVTHKIINKLKQGVIPWKKPWVSREQKNLISKLPYKGINALLLTMEGYKSQYWATFKQLKSKGISVKKGEKSSIVVFFSPVHTTLNEDKEDKKRIILKYYRVFNLDQTDYTEPNDNPIVVTDPIPNCERVLNNWYNKPEIIHKGTSAVYNPVKDYILCPHLSTFITIEEYYSTIFHELIHSTGHKNRLNRKEIVENKIFGSESYSKEELTAEIGASFLCDITGISQEVFDNQVSYINGWLSALKTDHTLLLRSASLAQKAVEYILSDTQKSSIKSKSISVIGGKEI